MPTATRVAVMVAAARHILFYISQRVSAGGGTGTGSVIRGGRRTGSDRGGGGTSAVTAGWVRGQSAERVGLPIVYDERKHYDNAGHGLLPGTGWVGGEQPHLPLRAAWDQHY
ncbi:hypothetical protein SLA2020_434970 [Shorea laevis]